MNFSIKKIEGLFLMLVVALAVLPTARVNAQNAAQVGFFTKYEVLPDGRIEVPLEVRGVSDLYAVDIQIEFDPALIEVEDVNPKQPGVQPALGTFLDAGLTLYNEVDNETGTVNFVMTQVNPSEGKSGDGVLLVLYFRAIAEGTSALRVKNVELADRTGLAVPAEGVDGSITISGKAETSASTPIPVQDPTGMIPIQTLAQTATMTPTSIPTATQAPTEAPTVVESEPTAEIVAEVDSEEGEELQEQENGSLWWLLGLPLVIIIAGVIVYTQQKNVEQPKQSDIQGGNNEG